MKKLVFIFGILVFFSCGSADTEIDKETTLEEKSVRIEVTTLQANDAVQVSYYDYVTDSYIFNQYIFEYDSSGMAIPVVISLDNYDFRYVQGEIYRNNPIPTALSLKIYIDEELIIDESKTGDGSEYINIGFNYDILTSSNI